jgi:hypothetical protein
MRSIPTASILSINYSAILNEIDPALAQTLRDAVPDYSSIVSNQQSLTPRISGNSAAHSDMIKFSKNVKEIYKNIGYSFDDLNKEIRYCPYCGFGELRDIEHIVPKNHYGEYAIFPMNLVYSCAICNGHKPKYLCKNGDCFSGTTHPYCDNINDYRVLNLDFKIDNSSRNGLLMRYYIDFPSSCPFDDSLKGRIENQFNYLHLGERFNMLAVDEIAEILSQPREMETQNYRIFFLKKYNSKLTITQKYSINHWETTLYYSLSNWTKLESFFENKA